MPFETVGTPILWAGFVAFVLAMLAVDLGLFSRRAHEVSLREAAIWSAVWVTLALVFGLGVWLVFGAELGLEFFTGYLIEKALAVDNIFVFAMVFSLFAVPAEHQRRILTWGVLGALILRGAFILAGGAFLVHFHHAIYVFGALLAFTGVRLLLQGERTARFEDDPVVRIVRRIVPVTTEPRADRFLVVEGGRRVATPSLLALIVIEVMDVIFAVDSVPAIFAVTQDPFIVFTSNIFAILGLRAMYFLLAGVLGRFRYMKTGLSLILVFVGGKMLLSDVVRIPIGVSLGAILLILGASVVASLVAARRGG